MILNTRNDLPFADGILSWATRVRAGETSIRDTLEICYDRADACAALNAFECLDRERATQAADGLDALLASGTDLGPLMGVPIGVKDILAVDGLPLTNGSNADTAHLTGAEGRLVRQLKAAGGIVFGKTRTVEFALGITGVNEARGTPWNAQDCAVHRIPGGSSSGSAVAVAAGIVGLGLGTDTGGSIRIPACLNGIVGHKTSIGRWPTDGIFPLSPTLDTAGPLCQRVQDAAMLHTLITGESVLPARPLAGVRIGVPQPIFLDALDSEVEADFDAALDRLLRAGAVRHDISVEGVAERAELFSSIVPAELLTTLTPALYASARAGMDSVTASRAAIGLDVSAIEYLSAQARRRELARKAAASFDTVDCWITPTCPFLAMTLESLGDPAVHERALLASRNTQPGNLFELCGLSLPMHRQGLPSGLQVLMPAGHDATLLALGASIADVLSDRT